MNDSTSAYPFRPELPPPPAPPGRGVPLFAFLCVFLLITGLLGLFLAPTLVTRWRLAEARADARAAYLRRQAELKAESEAADRRLAALDSKVKLTSLGFRDVARKVLPSVVNVSNEREATRDRVQGVRNPILFYDYNQGRLFVEVSVGSGILVKPGYILTNNHVVQGAQRLRVTYANGEWAAVEVNRETLATDPLTDLAVIHLPPDQVPPDFNVTAVFADSDKDVRVGDWALAVGSPLGLEQTMTAGIISAKGRVLQRLDLVEMLQTDAAINPGNSGGPLFDQHGRVVGVNVAIASQTGVNEGIGFAIPSNTAREIFEQLADHGEVVRGFLGADLQNLPISEIRKLQLEETGAVLVREVLPGQPAAQAGIRPGDLVVRYNKHKVGLVRPVKELRKMILETKPGQVVPVELMRRGRRLTVDVTIAKRPLQP